MNDETKAYLFELLDERIGDLQNQVEDGAEEAIAELNLAIRAQRELIQEALMNLQTHELKVLIDALKFSTEVYEDRGVTPKDSPSEHLTYLKEKALIKKLKEVV